MSMTLPAVKMIACHLPTVWYRSGVHDSVDPDVKIKCRSAPSNLALDLLQ